MTFVRNPLSDSAQFRADCSELGLRAASGLLVENLSMRPYNLSERSLRRWPEAADPEEVTLSILTSTWRRHGVGRTRPRLRLIRGAA